MVMDSNPQTTNRRHCFMEEDDGLASLAEIRVNAATSSGNGNQIHNHNFPLISRPLQHSAVFPGRNSLGSLASPRSGRNFDGRVMEELQPPHFLDSCFLCKKPLGINKDIYMYRGDTPFCSVECRQEQIEMDEAKEKQRNLSASVRALRKKDQRKSTSPSKTSKDYTFHTGTVAAA